MSAEQLAEAYDDGWTMAVFATCPDDMSGEDQLLRAVELQPADNPHRDGGRTSRLTCDRAVVAYELAIAVDGGTEALVTWVGVVDALVTSGTLRDLPADSDATITAAVEELLDNPTVRAADSGGAESFVAVSALREALSGAHGGCDDADCDDCRTEWGLP